MTIEQANPGAQPYVPRASIGGSDIGLLLGVNRYGDPADIYKRIVTIKGGGMPTPTPDNNNMERGRELEAACVRKYERETGRRTVHGNTVVHPQRPHMHANVDRLIVDSTNGSDHETLLGTGILETKCPRMPVFRATMEVGINPSYLAQIQHYFAVTDLQWGSFAMLNAEEWQLWTIDIERDDEMIKQIFDVCDWFWDMIERDAFDRKLLAKFTEKIAEETKQRAQLTAGSLVRETPQWRAAMLALKQANADYSLHKTAKEMAQDTIKAMIENEGVTEVVIPGVGKVTYKDQDRTAFDAERFQADHPDVNLSAYEKRITFPVLRPTFGKK